MRAIRSILVILAATAVVAPPTSANSVVELDPWLSRNVLNVAHAGGDLEAPHSTLFAFKEAVKAGADVLEMDVRLSSDGVLMVQHDDTVDRTTNGTGAVRDMTATQLQALDNAYWFVPNCWSCHGLEAEVYEYRGIRTGERLVPGGYTAADFAIPTLEQVAAANKYRVLDIEIKDGADGMATAEALAEFVTTHGSQDRFLVASFDDAILAHFKSLAPQIATSPGLTEAITWFANRGAIPHHKVLQVPPVYSGIDVVTQQFVDDAHADGLAVWVWFNGTEDDQPYEWQRLIDLGVDALLTGKPRAAQDILEDNDAAFRAAPSIADSFDLSGSRLNGDYSCPVSHVARCRSVAVLITFDRAGVAQISGIGRAWADRGTTRTIKVPLFRSVRGATGLLLLYSDNDDTHGMATFITML